MLSPSSLVRESMTRESGLRQNGQCMRDPDQSVNRAVTASPCAGSASAWARVTMASCTADSAARSYSTTCWGRRNVAADSPAP